MALPTWSEESDPLFRLLRRFQIGSPLRFAIAYLCLWVLTNCCFFVLLSLFCPAHAGRVRSDMLVVTNLFFGFVVVPMVAAFYCWISEKTEVLFSGLLEEDIWGAGSHPTEEVGLADAMHRIGRMHRWPWLPWLVAAIAATGLLVEAHKVFTTGGSNLSLVNGLTPEISRLGFACFAPSIWIGWYFVVMIVAREIMTVMGLHQLFRGQTLKLHPLHPDGCGGLGLLGDYALKVSYFAAISGLGLSLTIYNAYRSGVLNSSVLLPGLFIFYLILSPCAFFGTIGAAHAQMREAKQRFLKDIGDQFMADFVKAQQMLTGPTAQIKDASERIECLKELYEHASSFPVWPFDAASLKRFFASYVVPLVPIASAYAHGAIVLAGRILKALYLKAL